VRTRRDAELTDLPGVRSILDTRRGEDVRGIGRAEDGALVTYHVTDRPHDVVRLLRRRPNLIKSYGEKGRTSELGPGFYASGNPDFWMNRARGKWSFLEGISDRDLRTLTDALRRDLERMRGITNSEREHAVRDVLYARGGDLEPRVLAYLVNPPYGIAFWRPDYLVPLGLSPGRPPGVVELQIRGRFAELGGAHPPADLLRSLRRAGLQGAFTRAGIATNPELVIWDPRAIVDVRVEPTTERDRRHPVSAYRLRRRAYWIAMKKELATRYQRVPTSEGHRVSDEAFRRKVPLRELARRLASDDRLSRPRPEVRVDPIMRIR